jgi:mercuric ion transport protein
MTNQAENRVALAQSEAGRISEERTQRLFALGGIVGALLAASCCVVPLALFGLGVSGA